MSASLRQKLGKNLLKSNTAARAAPGQGAIVNYT